MGEVPREITLCICAYTIKRKGVCSPTRRCFLMAGFLALRRPCFWEHLLRAEIILPLLIYRANDQLYDYPSWSIIPSLENHLSVDSPELSFRLRFSLVVCYERLGPPSFLWLHLLPRGILRLVGRALNRVTPFERLRAEIEWWDFTLPLFL